MRCGLHAARTHVQTFLGDGYFPLPPLAHRRLCWDVIDDSFTSRRKRKGGGSRKKRKGSQGYPSTLAWTPRAAAPVGHTTLTCGRIGGLSPSAAVLVSANDIARRYRRATKKPLRLGPFGSVVPSVRTLSPHQSSPNSSRVSPPSTTCSMAYHLQSRAPVASAIIGLFFALRIGDSINGFLRPFHHWKPDVEGFRTTSPRVEAHLSSPSLS